VLITNCNLSNNDVGIEIISASSRNYISNNIFWNNREHARDNCRNIWDNGPSYGGNYWEGHNFSLPYHIPGAGENIDRYPLKNPAVKESFISFFLHKPDLPSVGQDVLFDATLSFVPNGNISYTWDFGDGNNDTGRRVRHVYHDEGWYNVTLRVENETMNDTFTCRIRVVKLYDYHIYISEDSNITIQDAINQSKPGYTLHVSNGTYHEILSIDVPYLNIIGEDRNTTVIDGCKKGDVILISAPFVSISGFTIQNSSYGKAGIQLGVPDYIIDALDCSIRNNRIIRNFIGINVSESERNRIECNLVLNNSLGVTLTRSYHNTLVHNTISLNEKGISSIYGSNWNVMENNFVTNNHIGVKLEWSHYNIIRNNTITSNLIGVYLLNSIYPDIEFNDICKNGKYGLVLDTNGKGLMFMGFLPNIRHNWWGSKFGPSWLIPMFGDRIWFRGVKLIKPRLIGIRVLSYPWLKKPMERVR